MRVRALGGAWLPLVSFLAACGWSTARPLAPPPAPPRLAAAGLQIALLWSAPVDLDLHVTDPAAAALRATDDPTARGQLVSSMDCSAVPSTPGLGRLELAAVSDPMPGPYRIGVTFVDSCGAGEDPVAYRVVVDTPERRYEAIGTLAPQQVEPAVLEVAARTAP